MRSSRNGRIPSSSDRVHPRRANRDEATADQAGYRCFGAAADGLEQLDAMDAEIERCSRSVNRATSPIKTRSGFRSSSTREKPSRSSIICRLPIRMGLIRS